MDGASEEFQFPNLLASNPMLAMQKFVTDLQSTVRQKDELIKQLTDQVSNLTNELKMHKSSDQHIHSRGDIRLQEFKRAIDKAIDDYIINETFPPTQIPQTLDANQPYTTIESEEHAASSSTSTNHTVNHLNNIGNHNHHNHANHESAESDYGRPNEFRTHGCESLDDNPSLRFPNENKPLSIMHNSMLMSPQRRFISSNGLNGTSNNNHNYHNNNNNNRNHNNNNNNNNNNRKNQNPKYTVFVSWSAKMDREDLNVLFDPNDVLEIRHSPNKQFAHFDLKNPEAMRKALSYDKTIRNPEHGQLRVEAGKPRSNNTENNNNNNNNGQRQQNKNYNNRQQNKQNGNMNGYNQQKPYNKYIPNGGAINGIHNNHPDEISDPSIPPIQGQLVNTSRSPSIVGDQSNSLL